MMRSYGKSTDDRSKFFKLRRFPQWASVNRGLPPSHPLPWIVIHPDQGLILLGLQRLMNTQ